MEDVNAIGYWEASRRYDLHESRLSAPVSSYVAVPVCMYVYMYGYMYVCRQLFIPVSVVQKKVCLFDDGSAVEGHRQIRYCQIPKNYFFKLIL